MNLLIREGKKAEDLFLKYGSVPDPSSTDNSEFSIFQKHNQSPTRGWR